MAHFLLWALLVVAIVAVIVFLVSRTRGPRL